MYLFCRSPSLYLLLALFHYSSFCLFSHCPLIAWRALPLRYRAIFAQHSVPVISNINVTIAAVLSCCRISIYLFRRRRQTTVTTDSFLCAVARAPLALRAHLLRGENARGVCATTRIRAGCAQALWFATRACGGRARICAHARILVCAEGKKEKGDVDPSSILYADVNKPVLC